MRGAFSHRRQHVERVTQERCAAEAHWQLDFHSSMEHRSLASAEERLRDAHAAEEQAETMLNGMAGRIQNYPELKARIEQHVKESQRHAELVRRCIARRDGGTSTVKDAGARVLAMLSNGGPKQSIAAKRHDWLVQRGLDESHVKQGEAVASSSCGRARFFFGTGWIAGCTSYLRI